MIKKFNNFIIESFNKDLFNSLEDKELWIRLNAERQIEWEKGLTYFDINLGIDRPIKQSLSSRTMEEALKISRKQCEYDEKNGKLRYSMEELLTLDRKGLCEIGDKNHKDWIDKFNSLK